MRQPKSRTALMSVVSALLMISFYGRTGRDAFLALALSGVFLIIIGTLTYFLRNGLGVSGIRLAAVILACAAAQAAWSKLGLEPWWALSALSLLLTASAEIRQPGKALEFAVRVLTFESAALCFFFVRAKLELTESRIFWQQPAGHLILLGLIALALSVLEARKNANDH